MIQDPLDRLRDLSANHRHEFFDLIAAILFLNPHLSKPQPDHRSPAPRLDLFGLLPLVVQTDLEALPPKCCEVANFLQ